MEPATADLRDILRRLRETPKHFTRVSGGRTDEQLRRPPAKDSWSTIEVLAHTRGAADVQGAWITRILGEESPTIRYASPRTGMRRTDYVSPEFGEVLRGFARQRADLVRTLSALAPSDWLRAAALTGTSPGWTRTVLDVASGIATHEHAHFDQITDAAAAGAVGA